MAGLKQFPPHPSPYVFYREKHEPFDSACVGTHGAKSIVFQTHDIAHLIKQFARFFVSIKFLLFN
jgi:hypothetical protein